MKTTECVPILINSLKQHIIIFVAAGGLFSTFINKKGEVLTCGNDNKGELGISDQKHIPRDVTTPTIISSVSGSQINYTYCGMHHAFAVAKEK
jgi:alpha-tubulin suppressor-like RCC1 family protein